MVIKPITNKEAFYLYVCLYVPVREKTIQNKQNKQEQEIYLRDSPERCQDQYRGENLKKKKTEQSKISLMYNMYMYLRMATVVCTERER